MKTTLTLALGLLAAASTACSTQVEDDIATRTQAATACHNPNGLNAMKAALAVAMAGEMGRVDAAQDLVTEGSGYTSVVAVSDAGLAACEANGAVGCPNTTAILGMQDAVVNNFIEAHVFNATAFKEELKASFERQGTWEKNLSMNYTHLLPEEHELTEIGVSDKGGCGVHYDYGVIGEKIENIEQRLVFFGGEQNPYLDFRVDDAMISIDPTLGMNGGTSASNGICLNACFEYGTSHAGDCCACDGNYGTMVIASWDRTMSYCAY